MTAAGVNIRPASYRDSAAIGAILGTFVARHHAWSPGQFRPAVIGFTPAIFQTWLDRPNELHLAAEIDGVVVGYVGASRYDGFANEVMFARSGVHVFLLMVAECAQRRGVGRALFNAIEAWAAEHEVEAIGLNMSAQNETARAFYAALGYDLANEYRIKILRRVRRFEADP
jgi:GNAT superfamily N-acetyltransferase